jgi:glycosyltransferase involved in cell wall biosynthesis
VTPAKLPISVFIIARNEADRIPHTIRSVRDWVDEVLVIDSESDDDTVQVAEDLGAKTVVRAWDGYGPQKVYGESLCRHDWILNLDADEEVDALLVLSIQRLFVNSAPKQSAFSLRWSMVMPGQESPPRFAPSDRFIRLYDRRRAGFKDSIVHDSVQVREGRVGRIQEGRVWHRSFRSYRHWAQKINDYSEMQAKAFVDAGKLLPGWKVVLDPPAAFLKAYLLRRYCIYGVDGVIHSLLYVHARQMKFAKIRERMRLKRSATP